jgi:hypothetical protein
MPGQALRTPGGSDYQDFLDNWHKKVARFGPLHKLPAGNIPGTLRLSQLPTPYHSQNDYVYEKFQ